MVASTDVITSPPPPSPVDLNQVAAGDLDSCSEYLSQWEKPILRIATRYAPRLSDLDDLAQEGRLAVTRAVAGYHHGRGHFAHYAKRAVRRAVIREAIRLNQQRRLENGPLEDNPAAINQLIVSDGTVAAEIADWLSTLPERQQQVYELLYVLGMTQQEAADRMAITQPRVAQLKIELLSVGILALAI